MTIDILCRVCGKVSILCHYMSS
uniref:Uncharacterized protein n=1 Tax=Arundo donax TaxID=35708 RepID=A0A0A9GWG0_ARUDO